MVQGHMRMHACTARAQPGGGALVPVHGAVKSCRQVHGQEHPGIMVC